MKPVAFFPDPFRGGNNVLVLVDTYRWEDESFTRLAPTNSNFRKYAENIFD